jgi:hypothetical protein
MEPTLAGEFEKFVRDVAISLLVLPVILLTRMCFLQSGWYGRLEYVGHTPGFCGKYIYFTKRPAWTKLGARNRLDEENANEVYADQNPCEVFSLKRPR